MSRRPDPPLRRAIRRSFPERVGARLQPLDAEDLAAEVLAALERPEAAGQRLDLGGPEAITLRRYLGLWRRWLGMGEARFIAVPRALARLGARPGEAFGRGPLGRTMWRMLERDSVVSDASLSHSRAVLEWNPAPMETGLRAARPAARTAGRREPCSCGRSCTRRWRSPFSPRARSA